MPMYVVLGHTHCLVLFNGGDYRWKWMDFCSFYSPARSSRSFKIHAWRIWSLHRSHDKDSVNQGSTTHCTTALARHAIRVRASLAPASRAYRNYQSSAGTGIPNVDTPELVKRLFFDPSVCPISCKPTTIHLLHRAQLLEPRCRQ